MNFGRIGLDISKVFKRIWLVAWKEVHEGFDANKIGFLWKIFSL